MALSLGLKTTKAAKGAAPTIKLQIDVARGNVKRLDSKIKDLDNEILHYQDLATRPHVKYMQQDLINHIRTLQGRLDNLMTVRAEAAKKFLDLINK